MASPLVSIGLLVLIPLLLWVVRQSIWTIFRRQRRSAKEVPYTLKESSRCKCGYALTNLDRIRCPECGRVFGFDSTPEELGLSDEELRKATEARERRRKP